MTDDVPSTDRRRLLAAATVAVAGGLAGCSSVSIDIEGLGGDGDSDGESDSSGDGGADASTGDLGCTDVTNGYQRQDVGERPILADFDYPALFDGFEYVQGPDLVFYQAETSLSEGTISFEFMQATDPDANPGEMPEDGAGGAVTTFNGEEVEFVGASDNSNVTWGANLPYQVGGEREVFRAILSMSISEEGSIDCGDALRQAAEHVVESLEVNDETTIG